MRFIVNLFITAVSAFILAKVLEPHIVINSFATAIVFAFALAILNAIVKPLLIILTLPVTILTLGFFLLIINAAIILLAGNLVSGVSVDGWLWALLFSLLLSFISTTIRRLEKNSQKDH